MRVHELAKELGVASKELLAALKDMGADGLTASSSVPDQAVPRLRASGGKAVPDAKLKEAVEEPLPKPRPKKKAPEAAIAEAPSSPPPVAPATVDARAEAATADGGEDDSASTPAAAAIAAPAAGAAPAAAEAPAGRSSVKFAHGATPQDVADKTDRSVAEVVKALIGLGEMATASQSLSDDAISLVANQLGFDVELVGVEEEEADEEDEEVDESRLVPRAPVVTIMGHVDHGKTLLLDAIRKTDVVGQEFGGITQHIGAYQVRVDGREVTFIDTPGHEAFTAMRARGALVTDIAVLVVAADDGVKPQTVEALDHVKAAGVPIVVAVNKIDKPESDPTRVRQQLVEQGIIPAEWGGTHEFVDVSAKARTNLDSLLETILLVADVEELKGDPAGRARGTVLEAHLDKGRGPVATVLVQRGTLGVGDTLVSGTSWARIRAMLDENGKPVALAGPSKPIQILGWSATPNAGD
ncbi:MAG: translation initiation factor IF-2, partial [Actinomycetota bacterium]